MMMAGFSIFILPKGWDIAPILGFFSLWIIVISESFLLAKVKTEMTTALESLRKKQETEIQDLLCFLRREKIVASPFESIEGANRLCDKIHYPAMVLTTNHQIIKANKKMHDLLGWERNELHGKPAHLINDLVVMSKIGELCAKPEHIEKIAMITKYVYLHKDGTKIFGQMDASKIGNEGFMVVFHPSSECIISHDQIRKMVK
jgi:PAS domain S-box-containing protein